MTWLGQNGEDRTLAALVGERRGRLLDIGAHDGERLSNTARLLESGWSGVLVEPSPGPLLRLLARYADREDVTVVGAVLLAGGPARMVEWHDCSDDPTAPLGDFYSTHDSGNLAKWAPHVRFRRMALWGLPMGAFVEAFPGHFELVSIDTEGTSVEILEHCPLDLWGTHVLCVEHDGMLDRVAAVERRYGFQRVAENAENVIAVRS